MTDSAFCRLPTEVLSMIFAQFVNYTGIRASVRLRLVCPAFDRHIQDAIYSLPTFETPDATPSDHLTWDGRMSAAMTAGLIHYKLRSHPDERALTREILYTADVVAAVLGEAHREAYTDALVHLTAHELPLHEILHGLARGPRFAATTSSPAENALVASLFIGQPSDTQVWIRTGARARRRTKWFGDALTVACWHTDMETFRSILGVVCMTEDPLQRDTAASRTVTALECGAAHGRIDIFSQDVCRGLQKVGARYGMDDFLKPALKSAAMNSHEDVVMAILELIREHDVTIFTKPDPHFWAEFLRIAASKGSITTIRTLLSYPTLVNFTRAFDLPLEDACRNGHLSVAELLTTTGTDLTLQSYAGSTYWAARNSRHDILRLLFERTAGSNSCLVDALCGAAVHGYSDILSVLVYAGLGDMSRAYEEHAPKSFVEIVDDMCQAGLLANMAADFLENPQQSDYFESTGIIFDDFMSTEQMQLETACSKGDFPAVYRILAQSISFTSRPTLLMAGCSESIRQERPGMVQYLFEKLEGQLLFVTEAFLKVRSTAVVQVLLDRGWSLEAYSSRLKAPILRSMVRSEEMTKWFLDHGANPNARCDLDITPLSTAVQKASLTTIMLLLKHGGDTRKGQLLHVAVERSQLDQLAIIDMLIAFGAGINDRMFENDPPSWLECRLLGAGTPLHKAAEMGSAATAAHLLAIGADIRAVDSIGRTALDIAQSRGDNEVIQVLETRLSR